MPSRSSAPLFCALLAGLILSHARPAAASPKLEAAIAALSNKVDAGFASLESGVAALGGALASLEAAVTGGFVALTDLILDRSASIQTVILTEIGASKESVVNELGGVIGGARTSIETKVDAIATRVDALDAKVDGLIDMVDALEAGGGGPDALTQARLSLLQAALGLQVASARMAERVAELQSDSAVGRVDARMVHTRNPFSGSYVDGQAKDFQCLQTASGLRGSFLFQYGFVGAATVEFIVHHPNGSRVFFTPATIATLDSALDVQNAFVGLLPGSLVLGARLEDRYTASPGVEHVTVRTYVFGDDADRCAF